VWFLSGALAVRAVHSRSGVTWEMDIFRGCLDVHRGFYPRSDQSVPEGWYDLYVGVLERDALGWRWLPQWDVIGTGESLIQRVAVPLHIMSAILALPAAWLFYRDRRSVRWARTGNCPRCGYDLSGLPPGAACPECGKGGPA